MLFLCLLSKRKEEAKAVGCTLFFSELRLINDCDEGTESVAGDGERKNGFIWSWARVERARKSRVSCWGVRWGGDSCVLCSRLRCWLKDPDLRSAGTAWLYHSEHGGLTCCTAGAGREHKVERCDGERPSQPNGHPTQCWAAAACLLGVI